MRRPSELTPRDRKLVGIAVGALAFITAFALVGLLTKGRSTAAPATTAAASSTGGPVPLAPWYWTIAVSKSNPDLLVLGTSNGLYRSADGGKTWQAAGPSSFNATSLLQVGDSIYAGGVKAAANAAPIVSTGTIRSAPAGGSLLAVSTDDGTTWTTLHPTGLPNVALQALTASPAGGTAVYALTTTGKLYRSSDGAKSFQLVSPKLGVPAWALAVTQNNQFVSGDMDHGAHSSSNAKSWQQEAFTDSRGGKMVMEYAVQPSDLKHVLMTSYGIEVSTDGGKTWHTSLKSNVMFGPVAWSPSSADVAYAIGFDRSLWRTDDGGKNWSQVH